MFRRRLEFPGLKRAVLELFTKFNPDKVLIEDKGSGSSLLQELRLDHSIWCLDAYSPKQTSDKLMRLEAQAIKYEGGMVYLPKEAPWLAEYVKEITSFPGSKFDDQVDSISQVLDGRIRLPGWHGSWACIGAWCGMQCGVRLRRGGRRPSGRM